MDELRMRLARAMFPHIEPKFPGAAPDHQWYDAQRNVSVPHPVPPLDSIEALGFAAKSMPEGWWTCVTHWIKENHWTAQAGPESQNHFSAIVQNGSTEAEARYKLLLAIFTANAGGTK